VDRRAFIRWGFGTAIGGVSGEETRRSSPPDLLLDEFAPRPPAFSIIPVVGDGKWVWKDPPQDQTGYLEPRSFQLKVGIQLQGKGSAGRLSATTPVPVQVPEQKIDDVRIETQGCAARLRQLAPEAAQLILAAPSIARGQVVAAVAQFRLTLLKQYHAYKREQFPAEQKPPKPLLQLFGHDSPGIQTRTREVRRLSADVAAQSDHPWDKAKAYQDWVWQNIRTRRGRYTSVLIAVRDRVGDCEERAAVFVALCRAAGIPARLVWVPNHNWAEFLLCDHNGKPHWIPAHTSCYPWFGRTGAHELVLPQVQWQGARPEVRYLAELTPIASEPNQDAGPGARSKDEKGEWVVVGKHPLDPYLRDGSRAPARLQQRNP